MAKYLLRGMPTILVKLLKLQFRKTQGGQYKVSVTTQSTQVLYCDYLVEVVNVEHAYNVKYCEKVSYKTMSKQEAESLQTKEERRNKGNRDHCLDCGLFQKT